ncbi:MAG TPA: hypothetical protein VMY76_00790 [Gemmatimonadales bacterium]|nr:hypothetical protein [Gemmatimonadales bacterium]
MGADSSIEWPGEGGITSSPLRCVRCGDRLRNFDPADPYLPHLCGGCWAKAVTALDQSYREFFRLTERCLRESERHPTVLAIKAYWANEFASVPASTEPF